MNQNAIVWFYDYATETRNIGYYYYYLAITDKSLSFKSLTLFRMNLKV